MNLFINAVSSTGVIILFDDAKNIIARQEISLLMNESSKLIGTVSDFLQSQSLNYDMIKNIVVVHGPGSFTGIRTIVLYVNTLAFIHRDICITPINFFELFSQYPIVKTSSKRDLFVKNNKNDIIIIETNEDFLARYQGQEVYGDAKNLDIVCNTDIDYASFIQNISFQNQKNIEPLYIKKPNIT